MGTDVSSLRPRGAALVLARGALKGRMRSMSRLTKSGLVLGGYLLACLLASSVVYVYQLLTQDAARASAGMYAFGDLILFLGVFGILSLFPTGLALYFLWRRYLAG
jgi:hypothetical protein